MEALGAAASIIGLIQVAGKLTTLGYSYIQAAKQASSDIDDLTREIASFNGVLISLQKHTTNAGSDSTLLETLSTQIEECYVLLRTLEARLEPRTKGLRRIFRSLKWPLKAPENAHIKQRIEGYKTSFSLAISSDHYWVSKKTSAEIKAIGANVDAVHLSVGNLQTHAQETSRAQSFRDNIDEMARIKKKRREILDWLYPHEFSTKHSEISRRRKKDTGSWLTECGGFQDWKKESGTSRLLWGYGIPGAGKTFLSSRVIDYFENEAQTKHYGVAHIYFNYKERQQQTPVLVLSSLVKQIALQLVKLPVDIERMHSKLEHHGKRPTLEVLITSLISLFGSFDDVFLIFDALDECDQKGQRMELLPMFHRMGMGGAHIFLTSRRYPVDIQSSFSEVTQIELLATSRDIKSYVLGKIEENPRAKGLIQQRGKELEDKIVSELIRCAQGMFLLVHFHIEYLCEQTTVKQLLTALETVIGSATADHLLDPTYDRVMDSIRTQPEPCQKLAMSVLCWLVMSCRPMTVKEIQVAVSVNLGQSVLDELGLDLPHKETLLGVCAGLVIIDEESNNIRLAHLTVHEYLLRTTIRLKDAHNMIATACGAYVLLSDFSGGVCQDGKSLDSRLSDSPLFEYVARHMTTHLQSCDTVVSKDIAIHIHQHPNNVCAWIQASMYLARGKDTSDRYLSLAWSDAPPLLHMVSFIGNYSVLEQLLKDGVDVTETTTRDESVLHWAVGGGVKIIKLLVDNGADLLHKDSRKRSILYEAVHLGQEKVIQFLLKNGASVHSCNSYGRSPLSVAAAGGSEVIVKLLLQNGALTEVKDYGGITPLHEAASRGHDVIVQILINHGTCVGVQDGNGDTPLHEAASGGYDAVVQILINHGALTGVQNGAGNTPLDYATSKGHDAVVRLLHAHVDDLLSHSDQEPPPHVAVREEQLPPRRSRRDHTGRAGTSDGSQIGNSGYRSAKWIFGGGSIRETVRGLMGNDAYDR